ncbi:DUF2358 domain-containing protein [Spirulina sp. CS-785/01]|uniref:DUF2358 domain-containing protein n=1 Tax=Spirulina sp. CS-785/01 TaxID=3021716 RepID=UPI00232CC843|nr:DUF2358 domain-containing protein [Spirulina sp. CS-785/01]MDB9313294.1 DUF2358 domain-containing protein [Spirulina sp. CS-785/01]
MTILETLKQDYQHFPQNQTYSIYAPDVYFKDPMTEFRGIQKYQEMIGFMQKWFKDIQMDLHHIEQQDHHIYTRWTLHWTTPLPWQPRISIPGTSELTLNPQNLIVSHIDYWDISRLDVLKQHLFTPKTR